MQIIWIALVLKTCQKINNIFKNNETPKIKYTFGIHFVRLILVYRPENSHVALQSNQIFPSLIHFKWRIKRRQMWFYWSKMLFQLTKCVLFHKNCVSRAYNKMLAQFHEFARLQVSITKAFGLQWGIYLLSKSERPFPVQGYIFIWNSRQSCTDESDKVPFS